MCQRGRIKLNQDFVSPPGELNYHPYIERRTRADQGEGQGRADQGDGQGGPRQARAGARAARARARAAKADLG